MKSSTFSLISTVFLLWFTIQVKSVYEDYLAYFFILTIGILHGANDISLINLITKTTSKSKLKFLFFYLSVIAVTSIVFFNFPFLALLIFIVFSCYHFGEQHFYNQLQQTHNNASILYVGYGTLIFGLLFYLNSEDTASIINELSGVKIDQIYFLYFFLIGLSATSVGLYLNRNRIKDEFNYFQELFLILLFALLFKLASLLWAFGIYFIIWHSLPSLRDQTFALYGAFNKSSFFKYIKSSIVNWVISVIGLGIVYYVSRFFDIRFVTLFFAFLAAITIPHVIVMYFLNKK